MGRVALLCRGVRDDLDRVAFGLIVPLFFGHRRDAMPSNFRRQVELLVRSRRRATALFPLSQMSKITKFLFRLSVLIADRFHDGWKLNRRNVQTRWNRFGVRFRSESSVDMFSGHRSIGIRFHSDLEEKNSNISSNIAENSKLLGVFAFSRDPGVYLSSPPPWEQLVGRCHFHRFHYSFPCERKKWRMCRFFIARVEQNGIRRVSISLPHSFVRHHVHYSPSNQHLIHTRSLPKDFFLIQGDDELPSVYSILVHRLSFSMSSAIQRRLDGRVLFCLSGSNQYLLVWICTGAVILVMRSTFFLKSFEPMILADN